MIDIVFRLKSGTTLMFITVPAVPTRGDDVTIAKIRYMVTKREWSPVHSTRLSVIVYVEPAFEEVV